MEVDLHVEIAHGKITIIAVITGVQFIVTVGMETAYSKLASPRNLEHYETLL